MRKTNFILLLFMLIGINVNAADDTWSEIQLKSGELSGYVKVSNPIFSPDGNTIYIPTSTPNGHLFAIDRESGNIKWVSEIATTTYGGGAVVDADGIIYQCGTDKKVYAINPSDGSKKWTCDVDAVIGAFPALSADGVLYCVTNASTLYAINTATGAIAWNKTVTGTGSAVAVDASGIYVGTSTEISRYSTSGEQLWKVASELNVTERGAFALDGTTLYAALKGGAGLTAIDMSTGAIKWTYSNTGGSDAYFPIVGTDGTIYFNDKGGKKVYAVNNDGSLKWEKDLGAAATYCGLVLGDNGRIYSATQGKTGDVYKLYGLDIATGDIDFTYDSEQQFMAGATIGADKRLYIGTIGTVAADGGQLLAIPIDASPVTSSWSVRGGNIYGTNRQVENGGTKLEVISNTQNAIALVNNQLTINVSSDYICSIYDIFGRKQIEVQKRNFDTNVDLSVLQKGTYVVRVKLQNYGFVQKIIL